MVFKKGRVCGAINCSSNKQNTPHLSFFRFPKEPERCRKWLLNSQREDLYERDVDYLYNNLRICALHFESTQFMNVKNQKLVWDAVPTLFNIPKKPPQVFVKKKLSQRRDNKMSKPKELLSATEVNNPPKTSGASTHKMFEAVYLKVEPPEDNIGSDTAHELEMFEADELKVEPPEDNTGCDTAHEPEMFVAVELKVESPEDNSGCDTVWEPEMFEAAELNVESPEDNTGYIMASTSAAKGVREPKKGDEAAPHSLPALPMVTGRKWGTIIPRPARQMIINVMHCCYLEKERKASLYNIREPLKRAAAYTGICISALMKMRKIYATDSGTGSTTPTSSKESIGDEAAPHSSPALPVVTGLKPRTIIPRCARKMMINVMQYCDLEKERKQLIYSLHEPLKRAAAYTGVSISALMKMRQFSATNSVTDSVTLTHIHTPTPSKIRKRNSMEIDNFDERAVRETIEEFYALRKTVPSLGKLVPALQEKTGCEWQSVTLKKMLKSMGFIWRKVEDRRTFLFERASLIQWRSRFLVKMKYMRESGREIFYLNESWIDTNLMYGKCWQKGGSFSHSPCASTDHRLIVASVGSRNGFIKEAQLTYCANSTQGQMSAASFENWFKMSVLPNLPPKSVIVMDDAPFHSRQVDKTPLVYDPKVWMVEWLHRRGVACDDSMRKEVLKELIQANRGSQKEYVPDLMAAVQGHTVVRLPPNIHDLSAADLAWTKIKKYVRNRTFKGLSVTNLQTHSTAAFQAVTAGDWEEYCCKVQHLEEDYWRRDGVVENAIDDVILNSGMPDSSDESEDSITEDSETESG